MHTIAVTLQFIYCRTVVKGSPDSQGVGHSSGLLSKSQHTLSMSHQISIIVRGSTGGCAARPQRKAVYIIAAILCFFAQESLARTARYRASWRDNPSTTMVIGWDQLSGSNPVVLYDVVNHGLQLQAYRQRRAPDRAVPASGMNNHFARLQGLQPNTVYYFVILDSEGPSRPMSFRTAPDDPSVRLSIIAGGDSRNHREACQDANRMVGKLRPHVVLFNGDMTNEDSDAEWITWFDDWQLTIGSDGRVFPVVVARGNHEQSNQVLVNLFDVASPMVYYALTLGGNLLRVYTLNSMIPAGGEQHAWLDRDLREHGQVVWKFAQYHLSTRPHTSRKYDIEEQMLYWSTLFHKYDVQLAIESDAHVVKATWPVRPSREPGSDQGFIRDDLRGTVYLGEGTWGAPLRANDDDKAWTRNSASFNAFFWIFVDAYGVEVRTVKTDGSSRVGEVNHADPFRTPPGLVVWQPDNGDVITLINNGAGPRPAAPIVQRRMQLREASVVQAGADMSIAWSTQDEAEAASFAIQRSVNAGQYFETLAVVPGKGPGAHQYAFVDPGIARQSAPASLRYRILCRQPNAEDQPYDCLPDGLADAPLALRQPTPPPAVLQADASGRISVQYTLPLPADVDIVLIGADMREVAKLSYAAQAPGNYDKSLDLSRAPSGQYSLIVKANNELLISYTVRR